MLAKSPFPASHAFLTTYAQQYFDRFLNYHSFSAFTSSGFSYPEEATISPDIAGNYLLSYKASCLSLGAFDLDFMVNGSSVFVLPRISVPQAAMVSADAIAYLPANANLQVRYLPQYLLDFVDVTFGSLTITRLK